MSKQVFYVDFARGEKDGCDQAVAVMRQVEDQNLTDHVFYTAAPGSCVPQSSMNAVRGLGPRGEEEFGKIGHARG